MTDRLTADGLTPLKHRGLQRQSPFHHQVFLVLRDKIQSGAWPEGKVIPSEAKLAEAFSVSRITVRQAVNRLAEIGLVGRKQGRGTWVLPNKAEPVMRMDASSIIEGLFEIGWSTTVRLLEHQTISAPAHIAEALDLEAGAPVLRTVRVRSSSGETFSHIVSYMQVETARNFTEEQLTHGSFVEILETQGLRLARARQSISAGLADPGLAEALGIDIGSPLLTAKRVMIDETGRKVQYIEASYRPDRFQYWIDLDRVNSGGGKGRASVVSGAGRVEPPDDASVAE